MVQPVEENPSLPSPNNYTATGLASWASQLVRVLYRVFQQFGYRINRSLLTQQIAEAGGSPWCEYDGTANAVDLSVAFTGGAPIELKTGMQFRFRAGTANTGATTINLNELGDVTAVTVTGSALPAGYLRTDVDTRITYHESGFLAGPHFVVDREVERGSSSDGQWTKFADGTMWSWRSSGIISPNSPSSPLLWEWDFPVQFSAAPTVIPVEKTQDARGATDSDIQISTKQQSGGNNPNTNSTTAYFATAFSGTLQNDYRPEAVAIGRWYD